MRGCVMKGCVSIIGCVMKGCVDMIGYLPDGSASVNVIPTTKLSRKEKREQRKKEEVWGRFGLG